MGFTQKVEMLKRTPRSPQKKYTLSQSVTVTLTNRDWEYSDKIMNNKAKVCATVQRKTTYSSEI